MDKDEEKRLMQVIAAEVRAARGRAGLSRSEAARRSGISLSSLNRWERAERPEPICDSIHDIRMEPAALA